MRSDSKPVWVLYKDDLVHVSTFAPFAPEDRPPVSCPVCEQKVIMKLGDIRVHHYAHISGDICDLDNPETLLHWNMKFYLQDKLKSASQIFIDIACQSCGSTKTEKWLENWDTIKVEHYLGGFALDVALLKDDVCLGAIEVFATHQVDRKKIDFLQGRDIKLLEIQASENFYSGKSAWHPDKPIPFLRLFPEQIWICNKCQVKAKKEQQVRELPNEKQLTPLSQIDHYRIIDSYYHNGEMKREIYVRNGNNVSLITGENISFGSSPDYMIDMRLNDRVRYFKAFIDKASDWEKTRDVQAFSVACPHKYVWDETAKVWLKR